MVQGGDPTDQEVAGKIGSILMGRQRRDCCSACLADHMDGSGFEGGGDDLALPEG